MITVWLEYTASYCGDVLRNADKAALAVPGPAARYTKSIFSP
jgi:hypothetical protein